MTAEEIFLRALEKETPAERAAFLDGACGTDAALRAEVEGLIAADHDASQFLEEPVFKGPAVTVDPSPISEGPGTQIGRYKLLDQVGEGGMGVVFLAEQREPVRRKVALKIIKPGMDSKQVIARFEAERQALAMMDHPNIAKVLDAGTTESGRPYFVMELVNGISVTQYCDERQLTARERLELFIPICQAVQHAHQKGIIHRDLKPSNILIALYDDREVPKIIDFGVAKATSLTLTEKTMFTQLGQLVGTVEYMSPEQAQRNQLDIDTRSDIYSLGVILYELLTGDTPFDGKRLRSAAFGEMLRIITEEEPPKPSTKISTLGVAATAVSRSRKTNPDGLFRAIRGDLDWVVMKALEKQRDRRYETAGRLAADIQRFLAGEAIEARPPSTIYRVRKIVARHHVAFATTAIVIVTMLIGTVTSLRFALLADTAREVAMREADHKQKTLERLHDVLVERAVLSAIAGDDRGTNAAIELMKQAEIPETSLHMVHGIACFHRGDNKKAIKYLEQVLRHEPDNMPVRAVSAIAWSHVGDWNNCVREMDKIDSADSAVPRQDYESLLLGYAWMYFDTAKSLKLIEDVVDRHPTWVVARAIRGGAKAHRALELPDPGLVNEALKDTRLAFELLDENRVISLFYLWSHQVAIHFARRDGRTAADLQRDAERAIRVLNDKYPDYSAGTFNVALSHEEFGNLDAARDTWRELLGRPEYGLWLCHSIAFFTQIGEVAEVLQILDAEPTENADARTFKGLLLAGIPERREEARKHAHAITRSDEDAVIHGIGAVQILCVLRDEDEVKKLSRRLVQLGVRDSANWKEGSCLRFLAGVTTVDQFDVACGKTLPGRLHYHFYLALRAIIDGNSEAARSHFEQAVGTGQIGNGYYHWAKAFCRLLNDNPNYPGPY